MATRLHDIQPGEVSLVHRGANRKRFFLAKADELDDVAAEILKEHAEREPALLDAIRQNGGDEDVQKAAAMVARSIEAIREAYGDRGIPEAVLKAIGAQMADGEDEDANGDGCDDENGDENENEDEEMQKAVSDYEAILKRDFSADERKKLADSGAALPNGSYPIENRSDLSNAIHAVGRGNAPHAEIKAHIVKRAKALGAADLLPDNWDVQKEDTSMTDTATVPVKKEDGTWDLSNVSDEARAAAEAVIKAQEDELAELRKAAEVEASKADEAIKIAKAEQEKRETREFIAKSAELDKLAKDDSEFGPVLRSIFKAEEEGHVPAGSYDALETVLKAANEAVEKGGLFSEAGRVGSGGNGSSDVEAKIEKAASDLRAANPALTKEQAFAKALGNDPALYNEYREEQA